MLCSNCNHSAEVLASDELCPDCHLEAERRRSEIIELARERHEEEGQLEIDDNALLSEGFDNGCYVQAWVWTEFVGTRFDKENEGNPEDKRAPERSESGRLPAREIPETQGNAPALPEGIDSKALAFVKRVADLTHEGELDDNGESYEPSSEDAIAVLNELIQEARQLVGLSVTCGECGQSVPYIIGCPDGAELCQDCFDAGQH